MDLYIYKGNTVELAGPPFYFCYQIFNEPKSVCQIEIFIEAKFFGKVRKKFGKVKT